MTYNVKFLRETMTPTIKTSFQLDTQPYYTNKCIDPERQDTIKKRFSPSRLNQKKQSPNKIKLRSTYSPNTLSTKFLYENVKNDSSKNLIRQNTCRQTNFKTMSIKNKNNPTQSIQETGLSNLQNKLSYLQQCVNKAKKQLEGKKSKKNQAQMLKPIVEKQQDQTKSEKFKRDRKLSVITNGFKSLKIPELSELVNNSPKPKEIMGFNFDPYSPRQHNIYYVSQLVRAYSQKNSLAKQHVRTSIKILKSLQNVTFPSFDVIEKKKLSLKKQQRYKNKKTIVFDLDETLIHCNESSQMPSDAKLPVKLQNSSFIAGINIRPYAISLLNELAKKFQLMIFTASHSSYANVVLDYLDPQKKLFMHRLYRQHCHMTSNGMYVKDLRIINRNLEQLVLVDNASYSYAFQLQNGVPILNFYEGQDYELKALQKYLEQILLVKDVRQLNKKTFKLHHYTKFNNPEELIQQLYMDN